MSTKTVIIRAEGGTRVLIAANGVIECSDGSTTRWMGNELVIAGDSWGDDISVSGTGNVVVGGRVFIGGREITKKRSSSSSSSPKPCADVRIEEGAVIAQITASGNSSVRAQAGAPLHEQLRVTASGNSSIDVSSAVSTLEVRTSGNAEARVRGSGYITVNSSGNSSVTIN